MIHCNRTAIEKVPHLQKVAAEMLGHKDPMMFAYQHLFSSTAGPHGGMGGAAMTTFQVIGFHHPKYPHLGVQFCDGIWQECDPIERRWDTRKKPFATTDL